MSLDQHPTVVDWRQKTAEGYFKTAPDVLDAQRLKQIAMDAGADDVGLVEAGRPELTADFDDVHQSFPPVKTVMSLVTRLSPENVRCPNRAVSDNEFRLGIEKNTLVARRIVTTLAAEGVRAMSLPAGFPLDLSKWPGKMWPLSFKTLAETAGMGRMGHHRLLIHPRFGSFVALGGVLIDREASAYDRPIDFEPCIKCKLCAAVCPTGAIGQDGRFNFSGCMTHNYRDRMGGFSDFVENIAQAKSALDFRAKVSDPETVSMWQSLSYGICNKSSYCMAVCPAGVEVIGAYVDQKADFQKTIVKPLLDKVETIYVVPGSDADKHVPKRFPHKTVKHVGNGLRPKSAESFLWSLDLVFQREAAKGLSARYHMIFTGDERIESTVVIADKKLEVSPGLVGKADLTVKADSRAWVQFLRGERGLIGALLTGKIKVKGPKGLMKRFAACFPS